MNNTLLHQLYHGKVYPLEAIVLNDSEWNHNISEETEYFKGLISPDDWNRFDKLDELWHDQAMAYYYANFVYGFRLGVRLMAETLPGALEPSE